MNRIVVAFRPRFEDQDLKQEFELTLSKKMTYDQVSGFLPDTASVTDILPVRVGCDASW